MRGSLLFFVTLACQINYKVEGNTLSRATSQRLNPFDGKDVKWISNLLNEMMAGPLRGRSVTIVLQEGAQSITQGSDNLLETVDHSFSLLHLPQEAPRGILESYNLTGYNTQNSTNVGHFQGFPLLPSAVTIIVSSDVSWWPFWIPPEDWTTSTIVLISTSSPCSEKSFLETPLLGRPKSLAVLCPYDNSKEQGAGMAVKVKTSKPLAAKKESLVDLGLWSHVHFKSWNDLFIDRFSDMTHKNMTVICWPYERPLVYYIDGVLRGLNYFTLNALGEWLHYELNYVTEGYVDFALMYEEVKRGNSDVFINPALITPERNEEFDLTIPYLREGYGIFVEIPPPLPRWQSILFPFTWTVWGTVIFSMICTAITYHIMNYKNNDSLITNSIDIMQSLLSEPLWHVPTSWRLRNFLVLWWTVSWFINTSYMSNLIAVLTAPAFSERMQTFEDLIGSSYRLCMLDFGDFVDEALAEATNPVLSALNDILDMTPLQEDWEHIGEEQCIEKVLAGTHAHTDTFSFTDTLYNLLGHGPKIYSLKEQLYPGYLSLVLKKNTPWKYKFDEGMEMLIETGFMRKWHQDSLADFRSYYQQESQPERSALSLSHLQGSFFMLGFGYLLGCFVMAWEVLFPPSKITRIDSMQEQ